MIQKSIVDHLMMHNHIIILILWLYYIFQDDILLLIFLHHVLIQKWQIYKWQKNSEIFPWWGIYDQIYDFKIYTNGQFID